MDETGKEAPLVEGSEASALLIEQALKIPVFLKKCLSALNDLVRKELAVLHQREAVISFGCFKRV